LKRKVLVVFVLLIVIIGLIALFVASNTRLKGFLSESHKVDANLLIIDGWLNVTSIEMIKEEVLSQNYDLVLTAGMQSSDLEFCKVPMNGFLIFYPGLQTFKDINKEHVIEITARSKMGGIYSCHFNFYVNDSIIADFICDEQPRKFLARWHGSLINIDSLTVEFTNDMVDENGDRDLHVKEVIIDDTIIINYQYNSVLDYGSIGGPGRIVNDYNSHPQIIRNKLFEFGVDSSRVLAITIKKTLFNRTLASAVAVRKWLKSSELGVKGINVVSKGIHSRRTWLAYRRILDLSYNVGIISLPDQMDPDPEGKMILRTLGETLDLIYYNIILIPYSF
jgi:hypothetical protein